MAVLKNYNGDIINLPSHIHEIEDTQRDGNIAYVTSSDNGFMDNTDIQKIEELSQRAIEIEAHIKRMLFIKQYESFLVTGKDFGAILIKLGRISLTKIIFSTTAIPSDKIASATLVSTVDSPTKSYVYVEGTTAYIAPEKNNTVIYANANCEEMFAYCEKVTQIDLSNFNTSKVTNMTLMFVYCKALTSLDLSNFDTSNVTNMRQMFGTCTSLVSLNLTNFNTSNVTNMNAIFSSCNKLSSLNISSFNTSKVTIMDSMFYDCYALTSLNLNNFNTSNVTGMNSMFYGCSGLTSLTISSFNTTKVTSMSNMFYNCNKVTSSITVMNPNVSYYNTFVYCSTQTGSKFTVNFKVGCQTAATNMVATKSTNSNVVLGTQVA